jgi:hypothetical protein
MTALERASAALVMAVMLTAAATAIAIVRVVIFSMVTVMVVFVMSVTAVAGAVASVPVLLGAALLMAAGTTVMPVRFFVPIAVATAAAVTVAAFVVTLVAITVVAGVSVNAAQLAVIALVVWALAVLGTLLGVMTFGVVLCLVFCFMPVIVAVVVVVRKPDGCGFDHVRDIQGRDARRNSGFVLSHLYHYRMCTYTSPQATNMSAWNVLKIFIAKYRPHKQSSALK